MADIYSSDMKFKKTDTLLEDGGWVGALVNAAKSFGKAAASNPVTAVAGNLAAYDGFFNNGEGLKTAAVNIQNTVMGLAPDILPTLSNIATGLFESADPQVKRERNCVLKLDQRVQKLFYTASMKKYIKQECNRLLAEYKKKDPAATKQVIDGINQASKKLAGKKEQDVKKKMTKYREATMNIDGFDILVFGTTKDISRVAVVFFSPARKNPILRTIKIPTMQDLKAAKESVELVSECTDAEALFRNEVAICESVLREYNEGIVTEGLTDRIKQLGEQAWTSLKEMIKYLRSLLSGLWEKIRGSKKVADKVVKDAGPAKAKERTIHVDYLTLDAFAGSSAYTPFFEAFRSIHAQIKKYSTAKTVDEKEKIRERIEKNQHQIMAIMRKGASYNHDFSLVEVAKALETLGKLVQLVEAQIGIFQDLEDEMKRDAKPIGFQATAPDAYSFEAAKQTLSLYMDFYAKIRADEEKLASLLAQTSGEATQESAQTPVKEGGWGGFLAKIATSAIGGLGGMVIGDEIVNKYFKLAGKDRKGDDGVIFTLASGILGTLSGLRIANMENEKHLRDLFEKEQLKKHCITEADKCFKEAKKEHKDVSTDVINELNDTFVTDYRLKDASSFYKKFITQIVKCTITLGKYTFVVTASKSETIDTLYVIFYLTKEQRLVKYPIPVPDVKKMN